MPHSSLLEKSKTSKPHLIRLPRSIDLWASLLSWREKMLLLPWITWMVLSLGRVLTLNYALPEKIKGGEQGRAAKPIWADADTWFERQQMEEEMQRLQAENKASIEAAEELHGKKMAEDREGEKENDPMAKAEAEILQQNQS